MFLSSDEIMGIATWFMVGAIFLFIGGGMTIKGAKMLYKALFSCITVQATCVEIQEMRDTEERGWMYRPVYEYMYEGRLVRASRLEYEEINHTQVGAVEQVTVEKKCPDLIVDHKPNAVVGGVLLFMGLNFFFSALAFSIPVVVMVLVS
ncbi:MAG: DUF3592 domain-containing protein [Lachnospiraceae bacterium]|nr:DUF3592 domain-containing protein [Lachnospiraceae bacterium]